MNRPPANWRGRSRPTAADADPATPYDTINALKTELHACIVGGADAATIGALEAQIADAEKAAAE